MRMLLAMLLAFMLSACSVSVYQGKELSLDLIKQVDQLQAHVQGAVRYKILEHPGQDFIDKAASYYAAMIVAWAWRDKDDYEYYGAILTSMFDDLLAEAEDPGEPPAPRQEL